MSPDAIKDEQETESQALWKTHAHVLVNIIASVVTDPSNEHTSAEDAADKIIGEIKSKLGGQRLYIPHSLSRLRKIMRVVQKNHLPREGDMLRKHLNQFGNSAEVSKRIIGLFGDSTKIAEISAACVVCNFIDASVSHENN